MARTIWRGTVARAPATALPAATMRVRTKAQRDIVPSIIIVNNTRLWRTAWSRRGRVTPVTARPHLDLAIIAVNYTAVPKVYNWQLSRYFSNAEYKMSCIAFNVPLRCLVLEFYRLMFGLILAITHMTRVYDYTESVSVCVCNCVKV